MAKAFIDEYLTLQLRKKIDEYVDLNLDVDGVLTLLANDLYGYEEYMLSEIKRYVMYIIWLYDNHKDRSLAFEKYKMRTNQTQAVSKPYHSQRQPNEQLSATEIISNEFLLEQRRKEQKRIDELSSLFQKDSSLTNKNQELDEQQVEQETKLDEILATLSDQEIQETLSEMLNVEKSNDVVKDENQPIIEDAYGSDKTLDFQTKSELFSQPKIKSSLEQNTLQNDEITFETIVAEEKNISPPPVAETLFDFDTLDDNGTQTLDDSYFLEEVEPIEDLQTTDTLSSTKAALNFLESMENKYGTDTLVTINEKEYGLDVGDLSFVEPLEPLSIGSYVVYKHKNYIVKKIETKLDFFKNTQKIVTLKDLDSGDEIKVNAKKIKQ